MSNDRHTSLRPACMAGVSIIARATAVPSSFNTTTTTTSTTTTRTTGRGG